MTELADVLAIVVKVRCATCGGSGRVGTMVLGRAGRCDECVGGTKQATLTIAQLRELLAPVREERTLDPWARGNPAERVVAAVVTFFGLAVSDLIGRSRTRQTVLARHLAWWLLRYRTQMSFPEIGRFTRHDHTGVMSGVRRISRDRKVAGTNVQLFIDDIGAMLPPVVDHKDPDA